MGGEEIQALGQPESDRDAHCHSDLRTRLTFAIVTGLP